MTLSSWYVQEMIRQYNNNKYKIKLNFRVWTIDWEPVHWVEGIDDWLSHLF